ncbi:uncharacterized protein LOC121265528 [Juglans microcarpa x Juglans regia]|uniref:uncharacterized protein LOC121265528 n=1 Tax=Juglans microcarpa x Juglans regia TaxID=2249226 RepID=UPI001B7F365E|nr:uncharacterized protein LOC121265528 [Juglans microcarpa x Juglans regia]
MEYVRHFKVESKSFFFMLEGGSSICITEHSRRLVKRHVKARGCFLHLAELGFEKKRGSVLVKGLKGNDWEDFAYHLGKVAGNHLRRTLEEEIFPPSNRTSYAAALSLLARSVPDTMADRKHAMGERLCSRPITDMGGRGAPVAGTMLGDVEGVLWEVRGHLSGLSEEISVPMRKVDWGLSTLMGQRNGAAQEQVWKGCAGKDMQD